MTIYTGLLAVSQFEKELEREIELRGIKVIEKKDRLYLIEGDHSSLIWAQVIAYQMEFVPIESISDAAKKLKERGRNWAHFSVGHHRRGELIQDQLPKFSTKPITYRQALPPLPMGLWTLWDKNLLLCSQKTSSPFPRGEVHFIEDKFTPPSRAYLKLWEFFTIYYPEPLKGGVALDVGSCPGGWTWVLANTGFQKVYSVDKAPIEKRVMKLDSVEFRQESAFGLDPENFEDIDWFCSDIICYPERLLSLVKKFKDSGKVKNFICTIKYQGETDWENTLKFLEIPHSTIKHLYHNKHEVTWFLKDPSL